MKKEILCMSLWGLSLVAVAQSAREEIHLDPALAAGNIMPARHPK